MCDVLFLLSCFPHSINLPGLGKRMLNKEIRKAGTELHRRQRSVDRTTGNKAAELATKDHKALLCAP
jgi:hypothetical protein